MVCHQSLTGADETHTLGYLEFSVNGSNIPDVDFDVGESYAGLLPITENANDQNKLYFWFFPSANPSAEKEILIWLNGGVSSRSKCDICVPHRNANTGKIAWLLLARGLPPGKRAVPLAVRNLQARGEPMELA